MRKRHFFSERPKKRKINLNIWLLVCVLMVLLAGPVRAVTHYVSPGQSIQAAIDDANDGDEIQVAPGMYTEAINFNGKAVRLYSSGEADVTTIDAAGLDSSVVTCNSGEDANTILEGFTITGGLGTTVSSMYKYGGGMYNLNSSPTVKDCKFTTNSVTGDGGGMYNRNSSPTVNNCSFAGNSAAYSGGGMVNVSSNPTVTGCNFSDNKASTDGGGMYNYSSGPTVIGSVFSRNFTGDGSPGAPDGGNGGNGAGMCNVNSSLTVTNCTFSENATGNGGNGGVSVYHTGGNGGNAGNGGGMYNVDSSPTLANCTFSENKTGSGGNGAYAHLGSGGDGGNGGFGAGMLNTNGSSPNVSNCSLTENKCGNGGNGAPGMDWFVPWTEGQAGDGGDGGTGGGGAGICNIENSSATVSNCTFRANKAGNGGEGGPGGSVYAPLLLLRGGNGGNGGHGGHGAMLNDHSSPSVTGCTFSANRTGHGANGGSGGSAYTSVLVGPGRAGDGGEGGMGAGIYFQSCSLADVNDCAFFGNVTGSGGLAGRWAYAGLYTFLLYLGPPTNGDGGKGGGIAITQSSPVLSNCTFNRNRAGLGGAVFSEQGSQAIVTNCAFVQNSALEQGGGIYNKSNSQLILTNCTSTKNVALIDGGGMYSDISHSHAIVLYGSYESWSWMCFGLPLATCYIDVYIDDQLLLEGVTVKVRESEDCGPSCYSKTVYFHAEPGSEIRTVRRGADYGGHYAIYDGYGNELAHDLDLTGVTVTASDSPLTVTNCVFWGDTPDEITGPEANITYCDVEGGYVGTGNINADPVFADAGGRLSLGSACMDFGSNNAPNLPAADFDGNPRIMGGTVDMGAFECTNLRIRNVTAGVLYSSIGAAINDANDGDEIFVLPGTYYSPIDFKGKAVRLYSTSGPEFTTINGSGAHHVVKCVSGEDANTILEGFTITGGNATGTAPNDRGGGMYCDNSSPTVINCTFRNNSANSDGGGMYNWYSSPTVKDCNFTTNSVSGDGGGMYNYNSSPTVNNCSFAGNSAVYAGGGMDNRIDSNPAVSDCTFSQNTVGTNGGGMCNSASSPAVTNCTFSGNEAGGNGSGMGNYSNSNPTMTNCILSNNTANQGGGIYNYNNSAPAMTNCILSNNSALNQGGGIMNNGSSSPTATNCILWGNTPDEIVDFDSPSTTTITYSDVQGGWSGTGNINADPCFVDATSGKLWLFSSDSPCVDTGDNNAPNLPGEDPDGNPRVGDGDMDGNSAVDMGTYEFQPRVRNVTRNCWYQFIQCSIDDANDGDRVVANMGTYNENIDFKGRNIVLTSIDPNDPAVVKETIIDGRDYGAVVTFQGHEGPSCVLDGFTVTQTVSYYEPMYSAQGIYCDESDPTIRNCVVWGCRWLAEGAGIFCNVASPVISECIVRDNCGINPIVFQDASNAIIEDCVITGNLSYDWPYAAIYISASDPIIAGCIISENKRASGYSSSGGIHLAMSNAVIKYCTIAHNEGMGIQLRMSNAVIKDCTIAHNDGMGIMGGASLEEKPRISRCIIINNGAAPQDFTSQGLAGGIIGLCGGPIEDCVITGNTGQFAGGICYWGGPVTNCVIADNRGGSGGGLAYCDGPISNCTIVGNVATAGPSPDSGFGGGLNNCNGTISNCTIVGNVATANTFPDSGFGGGLYDCNGIIINCIIRENLAEIGGDQLYLCSEPTYSCIQDWGGGGVGNIAADPCFVYGGYWGDANDPNIVAEPNDPNVVWVDGDYRLRRGSPCIDAGDNNSVPADISDLDYDGDFNEPIPFDLGGLPRFIEDLCTVDTGNPGTMGSPVVDMGAYEFLPADIDSSSAVNLYDLGILALHWGETACGRCDGANLNCDTKVDFKDLLLLTDWWLAGIGPEL